MTTTHPLIRIRHVVLAHRVVNALVTDEHGHIHQIGHLPAEQWFCSCAAGKRCRLIQQVRELVVPMEP